MTSQIITGDDVREAALSTLMLWLPSCIHEVCRQKDYPVKKLRLPTRYEGLPEQAALMSDQFPVVCAVSSGTTGDVYMDDEGKYVATWRLEASAVVRGDDQAATRKHLGIYTAAIRLAIVQHGTLGGFATRTRWVGEEYDTFDATSARTLAGGFVDLLVTVADVVDAFDGPLTPPVDPTAVWPPAPTVDDVTVVTEPLP